MIILNSQHGYYETTEAVEEIDIQLLRPTDAAQPSSHSYHNKCMYSSVGDGLSLANGQGSTASRPSKHQNNSSLFEFVRSHYWYLHCPTASTTTTTRLFSNLHLHHCRVLACSPRMPVASCVLCPVFCAVDISSHRLFFPPAGIHDPPL